jgi:hypothetical protein
MPVTCKNCDAHAHAHVHVVLNVQNCHDFRQDFSHVTRNTALGLFLLYSTMLHVTK